MFIGGMIPVAALYLGRWIETWGDVPADHGEAAAWNAVFEGILHSLWLTFVTWTGFALCTALALYGFSLHHGKRSRTDSRSPERSG